jgi:phosphoglycerol transferase
MPKATCLGDVLHQNGYKNIFVGGASRRFSGKLSFLQTHGYDEVYGRRQFLELDDSLPLNDWGVNDDDLFKMAKQKYLSLKQSGQPFNLTILTLGMHFPDGYLSPSCPAKFGDYRDSIACTTGLLADYVEFIVKNDPHADTDVIIVGDHLTMKSNVAKSLEMNTHRTIFNIFINRSGSKRIVREEIDHFDLFPTILADLNFSLKDGRAALGCSGFDKANCYSLVHDPKINAKLAKHSDLYDSLWKQ